MTETPDEPDNEPCDNNRNPDSHCNEPPPCEGTDCLDDYLEDEIRGCDLLPILCDDDGRIWANSLPSATCQTVSTTGQGGEVIGSQTTCQEVPSYSGVPTPEPELLEGFGPDLRVVSPAQNETVSGVIDIRGSAVDPLGVQSVAYWIDGQPIGMASYGHPSTAPCTHASGVDPNCPDVDFIAQLDTTQLSNGSHELVVVAADHRGNYPLFSAFWRTFTVDNGCTDTQAPIVTILEPTPDSQVAGQVPIRVSVNDDNDVDRMRIFVDGQLHSTLYGPPWQTTWDASGLTPGSHHEILVRAVDACENVEPARWYVDIYQDPPPDPCTSDVTPPQLTLTSPSPGASVDGPVSLAATASDVNGVAGVDFLVDAALVASDSTTPYEASWDPTSLPSGGYVVEARASDTCGNQATGQATVTVAHAPIGWLGDPGNNETLSGLTSPIFGWAVGDGGLSSVEMTIDGVTPVSQLGWFSRDYGRAGVCNLYAYMADPACPLVGVHGNFDTTTLPNGSYEMRMVMTGQNGLASTFTRTFQVDNPAPRGWVQVPAHNQTIAGSGVTMYGWMLGSGGLDTRRVTIDYNPVGPSLLFDQNWQGACDANADVPDPTCPLVGWSATLDTTTLSNGPHTLRLYGVDAAGRELTFERQFFVDNQP